MPDFEVFLYRIYDEIEIKIDRETREWSPQLYPPDGTRGVVVGYHTMEIWRGRAWEFGRKPGKYIANGAIRVRFADGTGGNYSSGHLKHVDPAIYEERQKQRAAFKLNDPPTDIWVESLPELPFYEMDHVEFDVAQWGEKNIRGTVGRISYGDINTKCNDGSPYPIYDINMEQGGSVAITADQLKLIKRGPVWQHFKNEPQTFATLNDEMVFHVSMGWYDEVRNPNTHIFNFNFEDLKAAVKADIADCGRGHMFSFRRSREGVSAIRFTNREFGERVRQHFLAQNAETVA